MSFIWGLASKLGFVQITSDKYVRLNFENLFVEFLSLLCNPRNGCVEPFNQDVNIELSMRLRNDPYQIFRHSRTAAGLYARQKWLGEAESSQWNTFLAIHALKNKGLL